jgi:hypothetical protein
MAFVQIIEYQTTKPDEIRALGEEFQSMRGEGGEGVRPQVTVTQDRDRENTYVMMVRFPSYEEAMENSGREDTTAMAGKMGELMDGPPTFRNLDVLMDM